MAEPSTDGATVPRAGMKASVVYALLREYLQSGTLQPGARLPDETALAKWIGCTRAALREALHILSDEGLLGRQRARGTRVRANAPLLRLDEPGLIPEALASVRVLDDGKPAARPPPLTYQLLSSEFRPAAEFLTTILRCAEETPVLHLERLVVAGGVPVGHWELFVPADRPLDAWHVWLRPDSFEVLLGRWLADTESWTDRGVVEHLQVEPGLPTLTTSAVLSLPAQQPLLRFQRKICTSEGAVLVLAVGHCVFPAATFEVVVKRDL
jgi:DNA-binding GntR family transcriptional regulator